MPSNIRKVYVSNFLVGLVFWYGIEKLFQRSIGINPFGMGTLTALIFVFNFFCDIPAGMVADKWSRKGVLIVSTLAMAGCAVSGGASHGFGLYLVSSLLYAVYSVSKSGTYQALIYDSLHEAGETKAYSKTTGRAWALFLAGAGVANLASGFLAHHFGYRFNYFVSIVPCILNVLVLLSIKEPTFHKAEQKEKMLRQIGEVSRTIARLQLLRGLTLIMTALAAVEVFKGEFGQLYFLHYTSSAEIVGVLWAGYAFTWALGSFAAHRLHAHLNTLMFASVVPLVCMSLIDSKWSAVFFMVQAVASGALMIQIETKIQEATPSAVRTSILSVISTLSQGVSVPAALLIGWLIRTHGVLWALYAVTAVGTIVLAYWLWLRANRTRVDKPTALETAG